MDLEEGGNNGAEATMLHFPSPANNAAGLFG